MNVLGKMVGKMKYFMSIFLILLVLIDRWTHLGLTAEDWSRIFQFAALALGADAVEGIAANFRKPDANGNGSTPSPAAPAPPRE